MDGGRLSLTCVLGWDNARVIRLAQGDPRVFAWPSRASVMRAMDGAPTVITQSALYTPDGVGGWENHPSRIAASER